MARCKLLRIRGHPDTQVSKDQRATAVVCRIRIIRERKWDKEDRARIDLRVKAARIEDRLHKMAGTAMASIKCRTSRGLYKVDLWGCSHSSAQQELSAQIHSKCMLISMDKASLTMEDKAALRSRHMVVTQGNKSHKEVRPSARLLRNHSRCKRDLNLWATTRSSTSLVWTPDTIEARTHIKCLNRALDRFKTVDPHPTSDLKTLIPIQWEAAATWWAEPSDTFIHNNPAKATWRIRNRQLTSNDSTLIRTIQIIYNKLDNKRIWAQESNSFKMVNIKTKWDSKEIYLIMMKIEFNMS